MPALPALPGHRPPLLLELDLTEVPAVPDPDDPIARLRARGRHQLRPILRALHEAAADRHVVGLIAKVGGTLPWAAMQELRLGVRVFAASGKPTLAWAESFGEGSGDTAAYVLATGFGEIWLQPGGGLGLLGVGVETTFVRGALDHLGIEPQFEQRHEFKNAADQLTRTEFTEAHRTALDRLAVDRQRHGLGVGTLGHLVPFPRPPRRSTRTTSPGRTIPPWTTRALKPRSRKALPISLLTKSIASWP